MKKNYDFMQSYVRGKDRYVQALLLLHAAEEDDYPRHGVRVNKRRLELKKIPETNSRDEYVYYIRPTNGHSYPGVMCPA